MSVRNIDLKTSNGVCSIKESEVNVFIPGLRREYTFVQISDLHIAISDNNDSPSLKERAENSEKFWRSQGCIVCNKGLPGENIMTPLESNNAVAQRIRQISPDIVFLTGDIVDYPSASNLIYAEQYIKSLNCKYIFVPGNHDAINNKPCDKASELLSELVDFSPEFRVYSLNEFDIIAIDDSSIKISDEQLLKMYECIKLNRPIILLLHVPLLAPAARVPIFSKWGYNWMVGEDQQCKNNKDFLSIIESNKDIVRAVFAGHVHIATGDDESHAGGIVQYTAAPCFTGFLRVIRVNSKK